MPDADALVIPENEGLIFLDWPAEEETVLVAAEGGFRETRDVVEKVRRVQFVVADELVRPAVDLVGSGIERHVDSGAAAAEFRAHGVFLDPELLDRVGGRHGDHAPQPKLVVVHAVEQEVVVRDAQPVDGKGFVAALILEHSAADVGPLLAGVGPRAQIGQGDEVPPIERKVHNAPLGLNRSERGGLALHERRSGSHFHGLGDGSHLEHQVHPDHLVHFDVNLRLHGLLEALFLGGDRVGPDLQKIGHVPARVVGGQLDGLVRLKVGDHDRGPGHDGAGRVGYRAGDCSAIHLGDGQGRK